MTDDSSNDKALLVAAAAAALLVASPVRADVKKEDTKDYARRSMPLDDFVVNYYSVLKRMQDVPNWKSIPSVSGTPRIRASKEEMEALLNFRK